MSEFTDILRDTVTRVPGALGAIFVAWDGEPVSAFAPNMPALDLEILGAQWGVVWSEIGRSLGRAKLGKVSELLIEVEFATVLIHRVTDSYYVVFSVGRKAHLATARTKLNAAVLALRREME